MQDAMVKKEVEDVIRQMQVEGYGIILIAHSVEKTEKDAAGNEFDRFMPNLPKKAAELANAFVDNIIFCTPVGDGFENNRIMGAFRGTNRWVAGSRFKYIVDKIEFNYDNLVSAIYDAVQKQEEMTPGSTKEGSFDVQAFNNVVTQEIPFDELQESCKNLISEILEKNSALGVKIQAIVDTHLGVGKKLSSTNIAQYDFVMEIFKELGELSKNLD